MCNNLNKFDLFLQDSVSEIRLIFIRIGKNKTVFETNSEKYLLKMPNVLLKEELEYILNQNIKYCEQLINIYKYNISKTPEEVIQNSKDDNYFQKVKYKNRDIHFKNTISMFKDLNCVYFFILNNYHPLNIIEK
jgi:hypothetical protein